MSLFFNAKLCICIPLLLTLFTLLQRSHTFLSFQHVLYLMNAYLWLRCSDFIIQAQVSICRLDKFICVPVATTHLIILKQSFSFSPNLICFLHSRSITAPQTTQWSILETWTSSETFYIPLEPTHSASN